MLPSQILLFDQPRSGSHLLARLIGEGQNTQLLYNALGAARGVQVNWLLQDDHEQGMSTDVRNAFQDKVEEAVQRWSAAVEKSGGDEVLLVKDHAFSATGPEKVVQLVTATLQRAAFPDPGDNVTLIPESLLLRPGTTPVLTIRNPALVVPSAYRVLDSMGVPHGGGRTNFSLATSHVWSRMMYAFYTAHGIEPVIVDADDYMTNKDFVRHLLSRLGLDASKVSFNWPETTREEREAMHPIYYLSQKTLVDSREVRPDLAAKNRDLPGERAQWQEEFRADTALVEEMVSLAMPHYQYLFERRLRMPDT